MAEDFPNLVLNKSFADSANPKEDRNKENHI